MFMSGMDIVLEDQTEAGIFQSTNGKTGVHIADLPLHHASNVKTF